MKLFSIWIILFLITINIIDLIAMEGQNSFALKDSVVENESTISEIEKGDSTSEKQRFIPLSEFYYADNQKQTICGDTPLIETDLKLIPSLAFATAYTAIFVAQHIGQAQTIWKEMGEFKFQEDITQDLWVDKFGHVYGAYLTSYVFGETLMEVGMSWEAATIWGGAFGLAYSSYVEVLDGYGVNWGFSPSDFYADVTGSLFYIGQYYFPYLQNFTPQFMYLPAEWHGERSRMPHDAFIDDYSSQTFWISVNVNNMLPENVKDYWPDWLKLSFGYAARNLLAIHSYPELKPEYENLVDVKTNEVWGSPRYIIALDYDLYKILPDGPGFWNWFKQSLGHFKLPSPAIEFSASKTRFYLLYPFSF